MIRVELAGGAWAEVATVVTFGIRRRVQAALLHHRQNADAELKLRAPAEVLAAMVSAWSFSAEVTIEGADAIDAKLVDELFARCVTAYDLGTKIDPKPDASSLSSAPAQP